LLLDLPLVAVPLENVTLSRRPIGPEHKAKYSLALVIIQFEVSFHRVVAKSMAEIGISHGKVGIPGAVDGYLVQFVRPDAIGQSGRR